MDKVPVNHDINTSNINNTGKIPKKGQIPVLEYNKVVISRFQKIVKYTIQFII